MRLAQRMGASSGSNALYERRPSSRDGHDGRMQPRARAPPEEPEPESPVLVVGEHLFQRVGGPVAHGKKRPMNQDLCNSALGRDLGNFARLRRRGSSQEEPENYSDARQGQRSRSRHRAWSPRRPPDAQQTGYRIATVQDFYGSQPLRATGEGSRRLRPSSSDGPASRRDALHAFGSANGKRPVHHPLLLDPGPPRKAQHSDGSSRQHADRLGRERWEPNQALDRVAGVIPPRGIAPRENATAGKYTLPSNCSDSTLSDSSPLVVAEPVKDVVKKASGKEDIVHFSWEKGEVLNGRYELSTALGDGTFGRVVLAHDRSSDRQVAIKIIRDVKQYMENAKIEADILKHVRTADPRGTSRCAMMYETFTHDRKFFCLVCEPLGVSLYDFMKKNAFRGFWLQDVQDFARQSLKALRFLHENLRLAHTDLKPENVLLQCREPPRTAFFPREAEWKAKNRSKKDPGPYLRPASSQIKLIDFGNATYDNEHHSPVINTRQYRSPEVLLESGWNELSDIWSLGCIIVELYTGELLFGTHENMEHLALMETVLNPLPEHMLNAASVQVKQKYLRQDPNTGTWELAWPARASSDSSEKHVRQSRTLTELVPSRPHQPLVACVLTMLTADPKRRPGATRVARDPFFAVRYDD